MQAWSGLTGFRGDPAGPPIAIGGDLGEYMGGVFAAFGALAVRRRVEHGGPGEHLDLSMLEAITLMQSGEWLHSQLLQAPPVLRTIEVPSIEPAKDGYVGITMVTGQQWLDFAAMVDCAELTEIPQLSFQIGRWQYRDFIRERIRPWLAERTVDEVVELGQLFRLPIAALGNGATIRDTAYARERGVVRGKPGGLPSATHPMADVAVQTGRAARAHRRSARPTTPTPWPKREYREPPSDPRLPLEGIRIVDLTAFWAGPAATHLLAAFGADVVKVESIQRPDGIRYSGGMRKDVDDWWEYGWVFHAMNTNKRSVTLDLGSDDGRRLFSELVADADVVIENFSPRVMDHFGLTADALLAINPRLVVARMPAFGLDGPWRDRVGFAPTMEQIAGLAWVTGLADGPPIPPRGACDPLAGVHAAFAVTGGAVLHRSHRSRPARRAADDRDGIERHRDSADGSRGIRRHAEPAGQPWTRLGRPEPLPLRGRRRLGRRHGSHRRPVAGAGRRDGPPVVDRRRPVRHCHGSTSSRRRDRPSAAGLVRRPGATPRGG